MVRDLMTRDPVCCTPRDSVAEAARRMVLAGCGTLPVIDDGARRRLVGLLTRGDILKRVVAAGQPPDSVPVWQAMTVDMLVLDLSATLDDCLGLMRAHNVRRIPVCDSSGTLVGIVTWPDLDRAGNRWVAGEDDSG
jgi:CBS domain-containing protein